MVLTVHGWPTAVTIVPLMPVAMIVPPTPGPIAAPAKFWDSLSATDSGQPVRLHSRIVPAAGSVLRVRAAPWMGRKTPGMPFGPACRGLIRTRSKWISSSPAPVTVA